MGDYVVVVNPRDTGGRDRRIVFETKIRRRRPTLAKALEEMDRAMLNRGCQVAVMVFAQRSQAPLQGKPLRFFHGNRVMVVWNPENEPGSELALEVAAQLARTLAIAAEREDLTLDRSLLAERLDALTNIIERGRAIKRGIGTARRGLGAAEDAYEAMAEEAMAVVLELADRVEGSLGRGGATVRPCPRPTGTPLGRAGDDGRGDIDLRCGWCGRPGARV